MSKGKGMCLASVLRRRPCMWPSKTQVCREPSTRESDRQGLPNLDAISVMDRGGNLIPLSNVTHISEGRAPSSIRRKRQERVVDDSTHRAYLRRWAFGQLFHDAVCRSSDVLAVEFPWRKTPVAAACRGKAGGKAGGKVTTGREFWFYAGNR